MFFHVERRLIAPFAPKRPMVCLIDIFGFTMQWQRWINSGDGYWSASDVYFLSTIVMFGASSLYHAYPSKGGFTKRLDLTAQYWLIIATGLPYGADKLALWWFGWLMPVNVLVVVWLAVMIGVYMCCWYRPNKVVHICVTLGLAIPLTFHLLTGLDFQSGLGWVYGHEVLFWWLAGLSLYVLAFVMYARCFCFSRLRYSFYAYYHLLLIPAVWCHTNAALLAMQP